MALNKYQEQTTIQHSLQAKIAQYTADRSPANIDSLTQLPNHLSFQDLFEYILNTSDNEFNQQLTGADKSTPSSTANQDLLAVLYFKIDRFKRIVDSLNKSNYELLIIMIAECLQDIINQHGGNNVIIKLEDSNFIILVTGVKQQREVQDIANLILNQFRKSFALQDLEFFLTASIGISFYPFNETNPEQLLKQAQQAMHYARERGGDRQKFYSDSLILSTLETKNKLYLETELYYALKRQQLEIYYQPKVELRTGKIVGAEALVRWHHPKIGIVMPNKFIPIAEQSSLIESIGEWVLTAACQQTQVWHQAGFKKFSIAVNLSGRQFKQLDLFHRLTQIIFDSGLKPEYLELELTEKILIENEKLNIQRLNLLKRLNVQISLDDFGTGYSSLGYLQQFPFDVLKIDRCFIRDINNNQKNAVITKSVIAMAHLLGLKVVAEGIETQAELAFLANCQCDFVQGFLFSRPIPVREFERLLFADQAFSVDNLMQVVDV